MEAQQIPKWKPALVLLADIVLPTFICGMNTPLFIRCVSTLRRKIKRRPSKKQPKLMLAFSSVLYLLCLVQLIAISVTKAEKHKASDAPFASGFRETSQYKQLKICANLAYLLTTFLTDGLLLWRCWVLYSIRSSKTLCWGIRAFLIAVFLAVVATGVVHLVREIHPPAGISSSYFLLVSLVLNAIFNILLVIRLLFHRRRVRKLMGPGVRTRYISIVGTILESALVSLVFMIPAVVFRFVLDGQHFGIPLLAQTQALATFLVVRRVAEDKAWNNEKSAATPVRISSMSYVSPSRVIHAGMHSNPVKRRSDEGKLDPPNRIVLP